MSFSWTLFSDIEVLGSGLFWTSGASAASCWRDGRNLDHDGMAPTANGWTQLTRRVIVGSDSLPPDGEASSPPYIFAPASFIQIEGPFLK